MTRLGAAVTAYITYRVARAFRRSWTEYDRTWARHLETTPAACGWCGTWVSAAELERGRCIDCRDEPDADLAVRDAMRLRGQ